MKAHVSLGCRGIAEQTTDQFSLNRGHTRTLIRRFGLAVFWLAAIMLGFSFASTAIAATHVPKSKPSNPLQIKVLSNRADLISGDDALVQIVLPAGVKPSTVKVMRGHTDITKQFAIRPNGLYEGLVTGLAIGANVLTAKATGALPATITITNYPNGGPIFSGKQIQPWPCLPGATDAQCNRAVNYAFQYKQTGTNQFQSYDPKNPPSDVATTTTDQGNTVPYIIRVETGDQDRGQYQVAVIFDPSKEWAPWAPQKGWNGKTYVTGGSGCGTHHGETTAPSVIVDDPLSRGFMVWSTALDHNTQNCNLVVQAESLMMAKEHIVETYGPIRYTIGSGCSGGSIYQQQAANDYPGIFDGILPNCSFPDSWSTSVEVIDCRLLVDYFDTPSTWAPGVAWPPDQQAAVEGHPGPNICQSWINVYGFDQGGNPREVTGGLGLQSCNVPANEAYDPQTNPKGIRCDLADYFINELGARPQDGFANRPSDNVGVLYGLNALLNGAISTAQFVDLNSKVGSRDIDYNPIADRIAADPPAIPVTYQGGLFNEGNNMSIPIIDLRGHDVVEIHHDYRSYVMRARLDKANGNHDNQVIWTGPAPLVGDSQFAKQGLTVMDQWLSAIEADHSGLPLATKVVRDKPAAAHDKCTDGNGDELPNQQACQTIYPFYQEPRMVAGEPFTGDVLKCQLKPLDKSDFYPLQFTDAQWAQLQQTYPSGVCDYSKPGVDQQPTLAWMNYADGPGGKPLGAAPISKVAGK
jgi:hypothetical protein